METQHPIPKSPAKELDDDITKWKTLREWLERAKAEESNLRQSIAERMFGTMKLATGAFPEGTVHNIAEGEQYNYKGKLETKWNRSLLEELITPTIAEAELDAEVAAQLIKQEPTLSVKAYKALAPDKRRIVDKMIITKQGAITLEIIPLPK